MAILLVTYPAIPPPSLTKKPFSSSDREHSSRIEIKIGLSQKGIHCSSLPITNVAVAVRDSVLASETQREVSWRWEVAEELLGSFVPSWHKRQSRSPFFSFSFLPSCLRCAHKLVGAVATMERTSKLQCCRTYTENTNSRFLVKWNVK